MKETLRIGGALVVAEREVDPVETRADSPDLVALILMIGCALLMIWAVEIVTKILERDKEP